MFRTWKSPSQLYRLHRGPVQTMMLLRQNYLMLIHELLLKVTQWWFVYFLRVEAIIINIILFCLFLFIFYLRMEANAHNSARRTDHCFARCYHLQDLFLITLVSSVSWLISNRSKHNRCSLLLVRIWLLQIFSIYKAW